MREKYGSREGEDRFVCLRRPSDAQGHGLSPPPSSMLCLDGAFYPSPPSLPSSTLPSAHASSSYHHTPPPCQPSPPPCSPSIIDAIYAAFGKYCSMNGAASPWIEGDGVLFFFFFFPSFLDSCLTSWLLINLLRRTKSKCNTKSNKEHEIDHFENYFWFGRSKWKFGWKFNIRNRIV